MLYRRALASGAVCHARARAVAAQVRVYESRSFIDVTDVTSEVSRFGEKIRNPEAWVRGRVEAKVPTFRDQAELVDHGDNAEA